MKIPKYGPLGDYCNPIDLKDIINQPEKTNGITKGDGAWIYWMPAKYAERYGIVFAELDGYIWVRKPKEEWLPERRWFKDRPGYSDGKYFLKRFNIDISITNKTGGSLSQAMVTMVSIDGIIDAALSHKKKAIANRYIKLKNVLKDYYNYE